jgi:O-acetylserine/cysteine efflux transporter
MACCFVWGVNLPWTRLVVAEIPPVFAVGLRFLGIGLCLAPMLRPVPKQWGMVFAISMGIGAAHFAMLFLGLAAAPASAVAIVGQLGLPIVTILSVLLLGEVVRAKRISGMVLAFAGVLVILWKPGVVALDPGLLWVVASATCGAVGSILMKKIDPLPALNLQAWVAVFSFPPLMVLSALTETGQVAALMASSWVTWTGLAFSVLVVSIFGHSAYYVILKRYEITRIAPLTLMVPVWAVVVGLVVLGEPLTWQLGLGAALTLAGVGLVASRENRALPDEAVSGIRNG